MIVAAVDPVDWRLELERVGPRLKGEAAKVVPGGEGWRARVESLGGFVESYKRHGLTANVAGNGAAGALQFPIAKFQVSATLFNSIGT